MTAAAGHDPVVSWFSRAAENLPDRDIPASEFVEEIRKGTYHRQVEEIRKRFAKALARTNGDGKAGKKAVDALKKRLPSISVSGTFGIRSKDKLQQHSGLLTADLDLLGDNLMEIRRKLESDPHVWAAYVSPTGTGLKVIYRVPVCADQHQHQAAHATVASHVKALCGVDIDATGDVDRMCYTSVDRAAYLNLAAVELPVTTEAKPPDTPGARGAKAAPGRNGSLSLSERQRIIEEVAGPVRWENATEGYCDCPGKARHTTGDGERDCKVYLGQVPTIKCMHTSCLAVIEGLNHTLRSRIGRAEWRSTGESRARPGSVTAEYLGPASTAERQTIEPPPRYSPPPLTLLPVALRDYVSSHAKSLDVDVAFVFLPLLSSLAAAIGNSRNLRVKKGFTQPAILWTTVVARSGARKSPALSACTTFFCSRERDLVRRNVAAGVVYEEHHREWEATEKKKRGAEPSPPPRLTCLLDDLTLAVVAPILRDNPRGTLVSKDELASWLGSFGQFSRTAGGAAADVSGWLSLHNGERLIVDRKTNRESYRIFHPRLSIAGCIAPSVLRDVLTRDFFQRGLPARILFAAPPPRPNVWTDEEVPGALEREAALVLQRLFALEADECEDGPLPTELSVTPAGLEVFKAFYNDVGNHAIEAEEKGEAAWNKLTGGAARLALVGHLAHGLDGTPIDGPVMQAAVALAEWFGREAERIYTSFSEPPEAAMCRRLVEFIERRGGQATVKEIADSFRPLKNQSEAVERWLNLMARSGAGQWTPAETSARGGRPTRKFRLKSETLGCPRPLNPGIPQENRGFADADTHVLPDKDEASEGAALLV